MKQPQRTTFTVNLETTTGRASRVAVKMYTRKGARKGKLQRVCTVAGLVVNPRHWLRGGGLTPTATEEQHAILDAVWQRLNTLTADLLARPRVLRPRDVRLWLYPPSFELWPELHRLASSKASLYRVAVNRYQAHTDGQQPDAANLSAWCVSMTGDGLATNSVIGYRAAVVALLRLAGVDLKGGRPKAKGDRIAGIALTSAEFAAIQRVELPAHLSRLRDALVIACCCSLRVSDWHYFTTGNIGRDVRNGKTGKLTPLPAHPLVVTLINRNGGDLRIPNRRDPVDNDQLREVARLASVHAPTLLDMVEVKGERIPRWQAVTSHVGRRTFVSQGIDRNVPFPELLRYTGHSSVRQLLAYHASTLSTDERASRDLDTSTRVIPFGLPIAPLRKVAK